MANPLQYQVHDSDDNDDLSYSGTSSPVITSPASPTRSFSPASAGVPSYAQSPWPNISPSSSPELGYGSTYASAYNPMSSSFTMGSMNQPTGAMGPPPRPSATDSTQSIHQGRRNKPAYYGTPGDASNAAGQSGVSTQSRTYSQQSNYDPLPYQTPPRRNTTGYYNTPGNTQGTASSAYPHYAPSSYSQQGSQGYGKSQGQGGLQGYQHSGSAYPSAAYPIIPQIPGSTQDTSSSANPYYSPSSYSQQGSQGYGKSQGQGGHQGYQHSSSAYPSAASSNIGESSALASTSTPASQSSQTYGGHSLAQTVPGFFESPQQGHTAQGTSSKQGGTKRLAPLPKPRPEWTEKDIQMLKYECATGKEWTDIRGDYPNQTSDYYTCLRWCPAEDKYIRTIEPESDWNLILLNMRLGRTVEEVQQRRNYLMALDYVHEERPNARLQPHHGWNNRWSAEEDKILRVGYARRIPFKNIIEDLPRRTVRAAATYRSGFVPLWSQEEDNRLRYHAIHQSWAEIASLPDFKNRIPAELEARWEYLVKRALK